MEETMQRTEEKEQEKLIHKTVEKREEKEEVVILMDIGIGKITCRYCRKPNYTAKIY
jgi:hypothetical protein